MQEIKNEITSLKTVWNEKIQEVNDVFGYAGISKENINKSLEESYNLLLGLEEYEDNFEVVLLKRNIKEALDFAKGYINEGVDKSDAKEKFNDFINTIYKIRLLIKQAYLIVHDTAIRTEAEVHALNEAKKQVDVLMEEYSKSISVIKEQLDKSNSMLAQTEINVKNINERHGLVEQRATDVINRSDKIEAIYNKIEGWDDEVLNRQKSIKTIASEIDEKQKEVATQLTEIKEIKEKIKENQGSLDKQLLEGSENLRRSKEILGISNVAGMAGSFKMRKDELYVPLLCWGLLFVATMIGIIFVSSYLVPTLLNLIKGEPGDIKNFILHLGFISPLVWLGWMSAKQYGYIARIGEDYSFKYAISMAFEGYKTATKEVVSEAMKDELLKLTIKNISDNPIRLYESKTNHGTPMQELLKEGREIFFSKKSLLRGEETVTVKPPVKE